MEPELELPAVQTTHALISLLFFVCLLFDMSGLRRIGSHRWRVNYGGLVIAFINFFSFAFYLCATVIGEGMWWESPRGTKLMLWRQLLWFCTAPQMVFMMSRLSGPYRGPLSVRGAVLALLVMLLSGSFATVLPWFPFGVPAIIVSMVTWTYAMRVMWGLNEFAVAAAVAREDGRSLEHFKWLNLVVWAIFPAAWMALEAGASPLWCELALCVADVFAKAVYSFYFRNAVLLDAAGFRALPEPSTTSELEYYMATGERLLSLMVREEVPAVSIAVLVDEVLAERAGMHRCHSENELPDEEVTGGPIRAIDAIPSVCIPFALLGEQAVSAAAVGAADALVPVSGASSLPLVIEMCVDEFGLLASASSISLHYSCDSRVSAATSVLTDQELLRSVLSAELISVLRDPETTDVWVRATLSDTSQLSVVIETVGLRQGSRGPSSAAALHGAPDELEVAERFARAMKGAFTREAHASGVRLSLVIPVVVTGGAREASSKGPELYAPLVYLRDPDPARPEIREYIARSLLHSGVGVTDDLAAAVATLDSFDPRSREVPHEDQLPSVVLNKPREWHYAPLPVTSALISRAAEKVRAIVGDSPANAGRPFASMRILEVVSETWNWETSGQRALVLHGVVSRANAKRAKAHDALGIFLHDGPWDIVYFLSPTREESEKLAEEIVLAAQSMPDTPTPLIVGVHDRPTKPPAQGHHGRSHLDRVGHHPMQPSFLRENLTTAVNRAKLADREAGLAKDIALENVSSSLESQASRATPLGTRSPNFAPTMAVILEDDEEEEGEWEEI